MVTRSPSRISTVACKGPFCVEVLSSFYGRFFVEEGQFINSTSSLHLCRHFFYLLTPPRFGALNRESESSGSQPVYRKLFPRGPHSSKNNFFEIKISRPTPWESLSVLLWLLACHDLSVWNIFNNRPKFTFAQSKRLRQPGINLTFTSVIFKCSYCLRIRKQ